MKKSSLDDPHRSDYWCLARHHHGLYDPRPTRTRMSTVLVPRGYGKFGEDASIRLLRLRKSYTSIILCIRSSKKYKGMLFYVF
jgi:hypothetical protein